MCGIAGYAVRDGAPIERQILARMAAALRHRGPDGEGIAVIGGVGLAHRRLAIIDLTSGEQPMASADGRLWITFNGEIYNYLELRAELEARGHSFRTTSDTETILAAYAEYGAECVLHLRGMFAFALYDAREDVLLLARDRFGIKPLYYCETNGALVFASELKGLLAHPAVPREIDPLAISDYLTYGYVPAERSIFRGISKLRPATILLRRRGRTELRTYWKPSFGGDREALSDGEWAERTRQTLAESVRLHMRADVPYGALLSGGLDSSAVVALMAQSSSQPLRTYTVGFEDSAFDERLYARQVAERFGTRHTEVVLRPDGLGALPELVEQFDEPFADASALPCFHIARVVARDLKVCLTGDGGDEAFGGYDAYRMALRLGALDRIPLRLRRLLLDPLLSVYPHWLSGRGLLGFARLGFTDRYIELMCGFDNGQKQRILTADFARAVADRDSYDVCRPLMLGDGPLDRMQAADYRSYLPDDILVKADRTSMRHGLELRVPFIDAEVFDLARRLPPELRVRHGRGKHVLREAVKDLLPELNLERGKQGFGVPLRRWLGGDLGGFATEVFADPRTAQRGILNVAELLATVRHNAHARPRLDQEIWTALMLELWCRHYLDQAPAAPRPSAAAVASRFAPAIAGAAAPMER